MSFDPYSEWLQIPPERRPATHYELLGLSEFEADVARIRALGMARIAHVRRFQVGQRSGEAIRLLGEMAQAFSTLTSPDRKQAYDAQLRRQSEPPPPAIRMSTPELPPMATPLEPPPVIPTANPAPSLAPAPPPARLATIAPLPRPLPAAPRKDGQEPPPVISWPSVSLAGTGVPTRRRQSARRGPSVKLAAGLLATFALAIGLVLYVGSREEGEPTARRQPAAMTLPAATSEDKPTADAASTPAPTPADRAPAKPLTNSLGMRLVPIPTGSFWMGSPDSDPDARPEERPYRLVRIDEPFYLGAHEVTVIQFRQFINATNRVTQAETQGGAWGLDTLGAPKFARFARFTWRTPGFAQSDDHPVVAVSYAEAADFCDWLSEREGRQYRLPSEVEWEHACRAGTSTRFYTGHAEGSLIGQANVADHKVSVFWKDFPRQHPFGRADWDDGYTFTAPVGHYPPNAWGLHDMHGNAREWCLRQVFKGGSFCNGPAVQRCAARGQLAAPSDPGRPDFAVGFRVLLKDDAPATGQR